MRDDSTHTLASSWQITQQGSCHVTQDEQGLHLGHPAHDASFYHNAQISDYDTSRQFRLRPPLRLTVTASASTANLRGTAGFGFWNHPFAPEETGFDVPQALWFFFASDESDMALAQGVAGHGWKAATINAKQWQFWSLLPTAPLAIPLMHIPPLYQALWPVGQGAIGVNETALDPHLLTERHTYRIDWLPKRARFYVDELLMLDAPVNIQHPLGFVAWLDNQYAIVSPRGRFGFGLVDVSQDQRLTLHDLSLMSL
ncbi:MAG: hypothetical protein ACFE0Q_03470 [Anaerolineae bacterium]